MNTSKCNTTVIDHDFMNKHIEYLKGIPEGMKTGFDGLDLCWGGLKAGCTYLIASRPAMGKTSFALNMVQSLAVKGNHKVAYFSFGEGKEPLVNRLLSMESGVTLQEIHAANLSPEKWINIISASAQIGNGNIVVNEALGISVEALEHKLSEADTDDVEVVFVDYLQHLDTEHETTDEKEKAKYICELLKKIAEEHKVAVVVLSQLTRKPEQREDHRPVISDLYDEDIVKYFDTVAFIYRDEYYNCETDFKNMAEIITVKSKFGNPGTVNLTWLPDCMKFGGI